jgi:hypothetical protein
MDQTALEGLLRSGTVTSDALLKHTRPDELDDVLALLARSRPLEEVRTALLERIATAPLREFNQLKVAYFRHLGGREH